MYDWANSTFATTVMAGFFPILFKSCRGADTGINFSTFILGLTNSITGLIAALSAPVLGAIADRQSARKNFLVFFAYTRHKTASNSEVWLFYLNAIIIQKTALSFRPQYVDSKNLVFIV